MAESNDKSSKDSCWGCITFIVGVLLIWALVAGLPINGKVWHIDLFPPAVYSRDANQ